MQTEPGAMDSEAATPERPHASVSSEAPARITTAERALDRKALLGISGVYLLVSLITFNSIEEDAFIYYRVVENIVDGHGYVFNRGAPPLEVGSSILWVLFLVIMAVVSPFPLVITSKLAGIALGVITLVVVTHWTLRLLPLRPWAYLPALLTAASAPFFMWNQRGLETPLYTLAVVSLGSICTHPRLYRYWAIPLAAIILCRSEGFILAAGLLPFFVVRRVPIKQLLVGFGGLVALLVMITAWRYFYFDDLLPNAFYSKLTASATFAPVDAYLSSGPRYVLLLACAVFAFLPGFWTKERITLLGLLAVLAWWGAGTGETKPFSRHFAAFTPLFYVLLVTGARPVLGTSSSSLARLRYGIALALVVATLLGKEHGLGGPPKTGPAHAMTRAALRGPFSFAAGTAKKLVAPFRESEVDALTPDIHDRIGTNYQSKIGDFVAANYSDGIVVVYDQMGQTPYRAGVDKVFVDSLGLCDRRLARRMFFGRAKNSPLLGLYQDVASRLLGGTAGEEDPLVTMEEVLDYLFARNPDLVMINRFLLMQGRFGLYRRLVEDPRLKANYEGKFVVETWGLIFERRGLRTGPAVVPEGVQVEDMRPEHLEPRRGAKKSVRGF